MSDFALTWLPILFFCLMCAIVYLLWKTVELMPRVKPTEITPGSDSSVTWDDVAGLEEAKEELQEIVDFLRDPRASRRSGRGSRKASCSTGRPAPEDAGGEGGRARVRRPLLRAERLVVRRDVRRARRGADPHALRRGAQERAAIVFIDELDAVGTTRSSHSFNREQDQTLNQLLVELDGFGPRDQVVVMGASNRLQDLDPALLRPGRFDRQILVQPPI